MDAVDRIYLLLETNPQTALSFADEQLSQLQSSNDRDNLNWAKAYALVDLKRFDEAKAIWQENFDRTGNHRALHQVGMVERDAGNLDAALSIYLRERECVDVSDPVAVGANLYELTYCNLLAGKMDQAHSYFEIYETVQSEDSIERGCFYRLKGDLFKNSDQEMSRSAYLKSLDFFRVGKSDFGVKEIEERLKGLF